jgi:DNA-binding transcriptional ArsR family regulator
MNKREQGMQYRVQTLKALAHLGYATTRQLAKVVWRRCDGSTRKMTGRTLRWLLDSGYIVTRRDAGSVNGEQLAAVTIAGATWLAENGAPLPYGKAHARDWLRHAHSHRTACNSVYAATVGLLPDTRAWSELEIRAGLAPLGQLAYSFDGAVLGKIPDVLVELTDGLAWVEVENSFRSDKDLAKVVASMRAMAVDKRVIEVHFVITAPGAKSIGARLRKALTHRPESGWPRQVKELDARILAQYVKVFMLNSDTLELSPVAF